MGFRLVTRQLPIAQCLLPLAPMYPLICKPILKEKVWGGRSLAEDDRLQSQNCT